MNNVCLMGNLTRDPELTYTKGTETALCRFTLAVKRTYGNETDFINCVAWKKTAETISQYVTKGQKIAVLGSMQTRSWEKEGKRQYATEIVVDKFYFAESKKTAESPTEEPEYFNEEPDSGLPF